MRYTSLLDILTNYYLFRFTTPQICWIFLFLNFNSIKWTAQICPTFKLALCLILVSLLWPQHLFKLSNIFDWSVTYLSFIYNNIIKHLQHQYQGMLQWHSMLEYQHLQWYARAIQTAKGLLREKTIWKFIDEMFWGIC